MISPDVAAMSLTDAAGERHEFNHIANCSRESAGALDGFCSKSHLAECVFCAEILMRRLFVLSELERLFLAECVEIFGRNWSGELHRVLARGGKWRIG
jgi:hypothetical protein